MVSFVADAAPESADPTSRTLLRSARLVRVDADDAEVEAELVRVEEADVLTLDVSARFRREGEDWSLARCEQSGERREPVQRELVRHSRENRVCLCMIVRDEADRYLARVLRAARDCVDCAVIVDDGSVDDSAALVETLLDGLPHRIVRLKRSLFGVEHRLRRLAFRYALRENPDWILALDADEEPETGFALEVRELVNQGRFDVVAMRLYDMWSETTYREDALWSGHQRPTPVLARVGPWMDDAFLPLSQHCGRFPEEVYERPAQLARCRVRHLGWMRASDRRLKLERALALDPEDRLGHHKMARSALDQSPTLREWEP